MEKRREMRIVIAAPSSLSIGELHNAICVARQLMDRGAEVLFLTPEVHRAYTETAGMPVRVLPPLLKQREVLREIVREVRPDALVLADYYLLDVEQNSLDLEAIVELPVPCATFDSLAWAPQPRELHNRLIRPQDERLLGKKYKRTVHVRALPEEIQILRTCPVNAPVPAHGRIYPVKLFEKPFALAEEQKKEVRQRLGLKDNAEKLIMFAKASWSMLALKYRLMAQAGHSTKVTYSYEAFLQDMLLQYLKEVDAPVTVVGVTPQVTRMAVTRTERNIRFVSMPFLEVQEFLALVLSCDLFVSDNLPSSAMAKAAFCGVPTLALLNTRLEGTQDGSPLRPPPDLSFTEEELEPIQKWNRHLPGGIYPFHLYPNGWIDELRPLFDHNPYIDAIARTEMYDIAETTRCFSDLLCNEHAKADLHARQQAYIDQVLALPSAFDTFDAWIQQAAKKGTLV